jgi:bacteriocin-like protein
MLFSASKSSDQLYMVEEEDRPVMALTQQDFKKRLDEGKLKDGTLVTQITVIEKFTVITVKELQKINGGGKE